MTRQTQRIPLPSPAPGSRRHLLLHRYGTAEARPKAYIQASLHADETPGMLVAHHLLRRLDAAALDDPDDPRHDRIARDLSDLAALRGFALCKRGRTAGVPAARRGFARRKRGRTAGCARRSASRKSAGLGSK